MRFRSLAVLPLLLATSASARADGVSMAKKLGGPGLDHGWGLAFDKKGNLVLSGFGSEALDLGGGVRAAKDEDGVFAAAYGPSGSHLWSLRKPLGPRYYGGPMALDAEGAALLVGDKERSLFFLRVDKGKEAGSFELPDASGLGVAAVGKEVAIVGMDRAKSQSFLGVFSLDGKARWRHTLDHDGVAVTATPQGDVVVAGAYRGEIMVEKWSNEGRAVWRRMVGQNAFHERRAQITSNAAGEVIVAYSSRPAAVAKISVDGRVVWETKLTGMNMGGVAVGPKGNVAVSVDGHLFLVDAGGKIARTVDVEANEVHLQGVAVSEKNRACVTGWYGGGELKAGGKTLPAPKGYDILLVCL